MSTAHSVVMAGYLCISMKIVMLVCVRRIHTLCAALCVQCFYVESGKQVFLY